MLVPYFEAATLKSNSPVFRLFFKEACTCDSLMLHSRAIVATDGNASPSSFETWCAIESMTSRSESRDRENSITHVVAWWLMGPWTLVAGPGCTPKFQRTARPDRGRAAVFP